MMEKSRKRHIAVIPPHEIRHRKYIEDFSKVVTSAWQIIPNTLFYKVSYHRLLQVAGSGAAYDAVISSRMRDLYEPDAYNIFAAARKLRKDLGRDTIFIISYNELLAAVMGLDRDAEKSFIRQIADHEEDPGQERLGGIIRTSSTDPAFLVSILADVLDGPQNYLHIKSPYHIESQANFLNHPPGHTMVGIKP
jgi:hypothetical protein